MKQTALLFLSLCAALSGMPEAMADTNAKFFPLDRSRPFVRTARPANALPLLARPSDAPRRAATTALPPLPQASDMPGQPKEMLRARTLLAIFSEAEPAAPR